MHKLNGRYIPSLSLTLFLDYVGVSLREVVVEWGNEIRISATEASSLHEDVVIPIDTHGQAYIPSSE